ncbi:2-amino-4-hydroxy-6-hydroxymethyldihydropteridine diphosphokinase [Patescibacteria group bacterium]|nr:2-amino-4-hydroxy-6-hydroxymethyldihydropteridine diphosphokinase [Patescibacteria group bacterium]MBU1016203.1 2-amino-4-hydroxy-6-hydroxymethyldihydropteridine diphosphokinase [Patescibacteria group bacterium]MBU1684680.1 2-amino-4-hydroxy-6-hydroxymethyldihydropteridine diphosphokinase [Patescibacteria group bacterium]MBU1938931.1 2-amino-4-hydroxy-6-hydroxymethyldihydropteridine diphosphokinase [Patescibacteria group bacterium]
MANKVTAYLALGSNIDDRLAFLVKAETMLRTHPEIELLKTSKIYETEPWPRNELPNNHPHEEEGQKWFLNQVVEIKTPLSPQKLADVIAIIEQKIGRIKREHWGAREIDIDILLYGGQIIDTPDLHIPHRHMQDRQFVLVPLVEIAPELKDPLTGRKFSKILEEVKKEDNHKVTPFL